MENPLEKLVGKKIIVETQEHVVYSGELVYCDALKEKKIKLKNVYVEHSPKLTAKEVLSQKPREELELFLKNIIKYLKVIPWRHPYLPSR